VGLSSAFEMYEATMAPAAEVMYLGQEQSASVKQSKARTSAYPTKRLKKVGVIETPSTFTCWSQVGTKISSP
jgi:hypothetical protein